MKKALIIHLILLVFKINAQEGRPALATETAENVRVKTIIRNALPHNLEQWSIEDESNLEGINWFHDGGESVKYPFKHEYKISYKKNVDTVEREKWQKLANDVASFQKMFVETQCEIKIIVNEFYNEFSSQEAINSSKILPFDLSFKGKHGARLFMGKSWKLEKTEKTDEGKLYYTINSNRDLNAAGGQIQSIIFDISGSEKVVDFFLKNIKLNEIRALIGQNKLQNTIPNKSQVIEKPLNKPALGATKVEFTLDGGIFKSKQINLKSSADGQFGYLNNFHPDINVIDNAVTRILISEDDDFNTKNKTGFLDITLPLIRKTGSVVVVPNSLKLSFDGGINCWEGCEYSFSAIDVKVTVNKYEPVGGFIEGTFAGNVKIGYKLNQPLDTTDKVKPNSTIKGSFKVRRREDRF